MGLVLGWLLFPSGRSTPRAANDAANKPELGLRNELARIAETLSEVDRKLDRKPVSLPIDPDDRDRRALGPDSMSAELALMKKIEAYLENQGVRDIRTSGPAYHRPVQPHLRAGLPRRPDPPSDESHEAITQKHLLWTFDDLLAAYGMPDDVWTPERGGLTWVYELAPDYWTTFHLVDEVVTEVSWWGSGSE